MSGVIETPVPPSGKKFSDGTASFNLQEPVISLDWSPDGKFLAVAGTDGALVVLDVATGAVRHQLAGHRMGTMRVAWSPDGLWFASAGQDGKIKLWHSQSGELAHEFAGGGAWVEHLEWARAGNLLLSAAGKKLRVWNVAGELQFEFAAHESTIAGLSLRADGKGFATICYGKVRCFRFGETSPYQTLDWKSSLISLAWSPNGRFIATGTQENTIQFFRLAARGEEALCMSGYPVKVKQLAWDRTARFLATSGGDMVTMWDVSGSGPAGKIPLQLGPHPADISALAYQRRGDVLASGCESGVIILWNPAQCPWPKKRPKPIDQHLRAGKLATAINQLRWSPDETRLAIGCQGGTVALLKL